MLRLVNGFTVDEPAESPATRRVFFESLTMI